MYALWKRYGSSTARYPVDDAILEGIGGYNPAALFYSAVTGGAPSTPRKVIDKEEAIVSWFPTLDPSGTVTLVWSQISDESHQNNWKVWYYADWIRTAKLQGGAVGNVTSVTRPKPPVYKGGAPPDEGFMNLHGYIAPEGTLHFIAERIKDKGQTIYYSDGRSLKPIYFYPKSTSFNTFNNPPRLLVDRIGKEHVILKPDSSMLEAEEIWDIEPSTGKKTVLVAIQQQGVGLKGLQAYQGPGGMMTVAFQAGRLSESSEAFLCVYSEGAWKSFGITKNSVKSDYLYKEFPFNGSYRPTLSTLRRYDSKFVTVFYDKAGGRKMLMTLSEYFSTGSFATESPSVVFIGGGGAANQAKPAAPASPARRRN